MLKKRILAILLSFAVSPVLAGEIAWPDPKIPVPGEVQTFISNECHEFRGWGDETVDECIIAEQYGYRAVVTILMDKELGERAARRYRGCAVGLGRLGGQFHRRKAECVSEVFRIRWRFAYSRETDLNGTRKARFSQPRSDEDRRIAMAFALSVLR